MSSVALLGVGRMGAAMARKLVEAGHSVTVWNRSPAASVTLAADCAVTIAASAADAVRGVDLVIATFANGQVTKAVLLDEALLAALRPGAVVCDMGTSGVDAAKALEAGFAGSGARFVDAPVSGSMATIASAQLLVMASGDPQGIDDARPILAAFSKKVANLGPAGAGQAMKLSVNLVVHTLNSAVSEALTLATNAGVSPADAYDIFQDSVVAAPFVNYKRPAFLDPATPVAMSLELVLKDLDLITAFADETSTPVTATRAVREEVAAACAAGYSAEDMAALSRFLKG